MFADDIRDVITPVEVKHPSFSIWWHGDREVAISYPTRPYKLLYERFKQATITRRDLNDVGSFSLNTEVLPRGDDLTVDDDVFENFLIMFRNMGARRALLADLYYSLVLFVEDEYDYKNIRRPLWMHDYAKEDIGTAMLKMMQRAGNLRSSFGQYAILSKPPQGTDLCRLAIKAALLDWRVIDLETTVDFD